MLRCVMLGGVLFPVLNFILCLVKRTQLLPEVCRAGVFLWGYASGIP